MLHNLTVVMPVWNRPESVANALSSLYKTAPDLKTVIVDQGSSNDTLNILSSFTELQEERSLLIQERVNLGRFHAVNRGLAASSTALVLCISQEHIFHDAWYEQMLKCFADNPDTAILSPDQSIKTAIRFSNFQTPIHSAL